VTRTYDTLTVLHQATLHRLRSATTPTAKRKADRDRRTYGVLWRDLRVLAHLVRQEALAKSPARRAERLVLRIWRRELASDLKHAAELYEQGATDKEVEAALRRRHADALVTRRQGPTKK
jgi:hypothetical protein